MNAIHVENNHENEHNRGDENTETNALNNTQWDHQ
jgi:hypothetical protein